MERASAGKVLEQLDEFLPGLDASRCWSTATSSTPTSWRPCELPNATLTVRSGGGGPEDLTSRLEGATPQQVIVLGYRDALSVDEADARTLLTLITLRMVWPSGDPDHVRIVAELARPAEPRPWPTRSASTTSS